MSATKNKPAKEKKRGGVTGKGFMPGKSGNPGGRPKGESLTAILRRVLQEQDEEFPEISRGERVVRSLLEYATRGGAGDATYLRELFERVDGRVPDRLEAKVQLRVVNDLLR